MLLGPCTVHIIHATPLHRTPTRDTHAMHVQGFGTNLEEQSPYVPEVDQDALATVSRSCTRLFPELGGGGKGRGLRGVVCGAGPNS